LVRVQLVRYWKSYLRKGHYRCTRYLIYLPVRIGERLDRSVDYVVRLFGPLIVLIPKGMEVSLSKLEKMDGSGRQDTIAALGSETRTFTKNSKVER